MAEFSEPPAGPQGSSPETGPEAGGRSPGRVPAALPPGLGPHHEPGGLPPRPRRRSSRPRIFPIFLGIILVIGFGAFALISFFSFFITTSGQGGNLLGNLSFGGERIALVRINDVIAPGPNFDFWMEHLRKIGEDDNIKGVVLRIESPGGSVASSQELYDEVIHLRETAGKTVYVSMGDVAASGGYYIAAASDRIFANKGTLTGSVGVISTSYQVEELAKDWGIDVQVIKSGRFKDAGSMFRPMEPDEEKMFELLINNAYDQFISDILAEREDELALALDGFDAWEKYLFERTEDSDARAFLLQIADGRVYSGEQAHELGLVDELGALNATVDRLTEDLGLPPDSRVYVPQRKVGLFDALSATLSGGFPSALKHPSLQYRMLPF
jgi:protease-4